MWHVVFTDSGTFPQSRAARSRDTAIHIACELLSQSCDVLRIIEPNGHMIERPELDEHFDHGRFPGLWRQSRVAKDNSAEAFHFLTSDNLRPAVAR